MKKSILKKKSADDNKSMKNYHAWNEFGFKQIYLLDSLAPV